MNLYSVLRWGNEESEDGPDGYDTEFLVKASSIDEAAKLVDEALRKIPPGNSRVQRFCHSISEVGISHSLDQTPKILFGPLVSELSVFCDSGVPNDKKWRRDSVDEGWISFQDYFDD